jgi:hypothetical protein
MQFKVSRISALIAFARNEIIMKFLPSINFITHDDDDDDSDGKLQQRHQKAGWFKSSFNPEKILNAG